MLTVSTASSISKVVYLGISVGVDSRIWLPNALVILPVGVSDPVFIGLKPENGAKDKYNNKACSHFNVKGDIVYVDRSRIMSRIVNPFNYVNSEGKTVKFIRSEFYVTGKPTMVACSIGLWGSSQTTLTPMFKRSGVSDPYTVLSQRVFYTRQNYVYASTKMYSRKVADGPVTKVTHTHTIFEFTADFSKVRQKVLVTYSEDILNPLLVTFGSWINWNTNTFLLGCSDNPTYDLPSLAQLRRRFELSRVRNTRIPDLVRFGDLVQEAADSTRALEINTPMYLRDLLQIMTLAKQLVSLATADVSLKVVSAAYLVAHYGLKLTVSDTQAIAKALDEAHNMDATLPFQVARARASENVTVTYGLPVPTEATISYNVKLYYDPVFEGVRGLWHQLHSWDVLPTLANLWDIIPFSFVIDWFVNVGAYFESIDTKDYMGVMRIQSTIVTRRASYEVPAEFFFGRTTQGYYIGNVELVDYERQVLPIPPQPFSRFDVPRSFTHWVEGTAIIVQKAMK